MACDNPEKILDSDASSAADMDVHVVEMDRETEDADPELGARLGEDRSNQTGVIDQRAGATRFLRPQDDVKTLPDGERSTALLLAAGVGASVGFR